MGEHTRTVEYTLRHTHITRHRHPTQLSQNMAAQQSGGQSAKVDHPKANTANTANNSQFSHAREYKDGEPEHHHAPPDSHEALTAGTLAQEKGNRHFVSSLEDAAEDQDQEAKDAHAQHSSGRSQQGSTASGAGAAARSTSSKSAGAGQDRSSGQSGNSVQSGGTSQSSSSAQSGHRAQDGASGNASGAARHDNQAGLLAA